MSEELERYKAPQIAELDSWAKKLYESGTFTDVQSAAQAFVKIAAGAEMGLTPFQSITGVHFIQNKPVVGAGLLASMLDRAPYNYTVEWTPDIEKPEACTITVFKNGVERGKARFSLSDAKRAGLTGANWQKYPDDMLFARAVSKAARRYAPGAMGTTFYVEAHGETEIVPPPSNVVATVIPYVDPDDPLDDVPFEDSSQNAAPAASNPAESPPPTGPAAAEPAGDSDPGGLTIIESLADAQRLVNTLDGPQLGVLKRMLDIDGKTTRRLLADALLEQRHEWDTQDILAEMSGWA